MAAHINVLYARGQFAAAIELYRQAAAVVVRFAQDSGDSNAQFTRGLFETHLALALLKSGQVEEARSLHLRCAMLLDEVLKRDGSLRTEYASGINALGLGEAGPLDWPGFPAGRAPGCAAPLPALNPGPDSR